MTVPTQPILSLNAFDADDAGSFDPALQDILARRHRNAGRSSVLVYRRPLHVERAEGQYIYASDGRRYLDFYNNVPSVGHGHPHVADAVHRQMLTANSHSRYLYDVVEAYAERLLATFPETLSNVTFTCTGSEANDLALRTARAVTGKKGIVVTRAAYHGNTSAVTEVSPSSYKVGAPPPYVRIIEPPDPAVYGDDVATGFAEALGDAIAGLEGEGHGFAALLVDTIFSSDGIYTDPAGFLRPAIERVGQAGGLFIADEVQPGFGRTGDALWGFLRHGVTPDIVTLGKPMGNGYPIGGMVSRAGLLDALTSRYGYFNTFGGTPAAAAAGSAVLDVIENERLMENAKVTGALLKQAVAALRDRFGILSDVRGSGLYVGVNVEPASGPTANDDRVVRIVNGLRERGVLIGVAGARADVLKIRPPLCVTEADVSHFAEQLSAVLQEQ